MDNPPTRLQQRIIADISLHEGTTSLEIANRLDLAHRSVVTSLSYINGIYVTDGTVIYDWPGPGKNGCMHTPKGVKHWSIGDTKHVDGWCPDMVERMERLNAETAEAPDDDEGGHPT